MMYKIRATFAGAEPLGLEMQDTEVVLRTQPGPSRLHHLHHLHHLILLIVITTTTPQRTQTRPLLLSYQDLYHSKWLFGAITRRSQRGFYPHTIYI